ncbi:hypothetical protein [Croceimicrobium hydrocarbonivorans]|uniref:Uncharacterized protein n=1 Tax=Croceimicrobium hydrocarbonivorans TaxID=2761580 RepID=A0A7H0VH67_9FLAO|nr:hypothetical protein [Croceimicrobium hydrocarbonivorans]QNR25065.1 hypothetical protein H4K34_04245 [Croceimicrobium hydrocarbonivorans]
MDQKEHIEALKDIRQMMQRSVRFLSLSGLSGIFAGIYALAAAYLAYLKLESGAGRTDARGTLIYLMALALGCLILAIGTAFFFTRKNARKKGLKLWDDSARLAFINLSIPLATGGLFAIALIRAGAIGFVAPATLVFYGLALINASRHTFPMIRQLGILEILLGLIAAFVWGHGLLFWAIGFGLLHIVYGLFMYFKFERS